MAAQIPVEYRRSFGSGQDPPVWSKAVAAGPHLDRQARLDIVEPCRSATPASRDDRFARDGVVSDSLQDGLALRARPTPDVNEEQEAVAEQPSEADSVHGVRRRKEDAQEAVGRSRLGDPCDVVLLDRSRPCSSAPSAPLGFEHS